MKKRIIYDFFSNIENKTMAEDALGKALPLLPWWSLKWRMGTCGSHKKPMTSWQRWEPRYDY